MRVMVKTKPGSPLPYEFKDLDVRAMSEEEREKRIRLIVLEELREHWEQTCRQPVGKQLRKARRRRLKGVRLALAVARLSQ